MTTLSPPPVYGGFAPPPKPVSRWRRFVPRSRRGKSAVAGGLAVVLVAGILGATYETSPGGTLWGAEKTVFPEHAQDVALDAVVTDLKRAQEILGSGQQPTPDQLTDARTSLNQAKQDMAYVSPSAEQASLQNLYMQLTQQLLQYTPDSVQQLPALPAPPPPPAADPGDPTQPDAALTSATAPTWGYPITDQSGTVAPDDYYAAPPPGVPDAPEGYWPQPYAPPLTPNLQDLGYYDQSWGQLYGYDPGNWYDYGLNGYNQYGYDFLGFDRWGYDRSGYDRWGYDHWGYSWAGYNWAGYNRDGWDRDGRNEWGQRHDYPGDPRDQGWYDHHHPYQQYYQWKFRNDDPVFRRSQWDRSRGFNPGLYQDWNKNRDWHDPRHRDWAPLTFTSNTSVDVHATSPVVNLNASLTQFISNDKKSINSGPLMKDLATKPARDFTRELTPRDTSSLWSRPGDVVGKTAPPPTNHRTTLAPPALSASAPAAPPSKVAPDFVAPKLAPVPAYTPPKATAPQSKSGTTPPSSVLGRGDDPSSLWGRTPKAGSPPNPAVAPPDDAMPSAPQREHSDQRPDSAPQAPESQPRDRSAEAAPEAPPQRTAPDAPAHDAQVPESRGTAPKSDVPAPEVRAPAPKVDAPAPKADAPAPKADAPAPKAEAPAQEAPARQAPTRQAPVQQAPQQREPARQAPPPRAPEAAPSQPARQAPPAREAPAREAPAPRPAPQPRQAPAPRAPSCSMPMCR